ncbi:MAG: FAD-dependent oxidoreductase [Lachnospiraceae bacterium]|nr:FAD-dependent oxidoreductase [Lachnospiraceae bacterium]
MLKIVDIKLEVGKEDALLKRVASILKVNIEDIKSLIVDKRSLDARKKPSIFYIYQVHVSLANENTKSIKKIIEKEKRVSIYKDTPYNFNREINENRDKLNTRPVIIGAGPCGLFAAYELSIHGYKPIILERGKCVEERKSDVDKFFETGVLDTSSNVQFGEGGAGTFSDGKLNTLVKDPDGRGREVLRIFHECGADEDILYDAKPHIGTDVLFNVLINFRKRIENAGGEFRFNTLVNDFEIKNGRITAVLTDKEKINTDTVILAIGHSARDTFKVLYEKDIKMEAKSFAVGFRVEHPQELIDKSQYGAIDKNLPAAAYKLTHTAENARGVYTFCMCPGGVIVNASSEEGKLAVNGMSYKKRDGKNANSAVIVTVTPDDFKGDGPLSGIEFQREIEKKAFDLCNGKIPQQLFNDFVDDKPSVSYGEYTSDTKGVHEFTNLRKLYSEDINKAFIEGIRSFGKKIEGFDRKDMIMSGVESRTSSPVRITRDEKLQSNVKGLFPAGEGAGYAGGIMSAAMDGMRIAERIAGMYLPFNED